MFRSISIIVGWAKARRFAIAAIDRALEGVEGTTAVHLCFGYVFTKPSGYPFARVECLQGRSDLD
jgi:hypothetical protein